MTTELLPCPFCTSSTAPELVDNIDMRIHTEIQEFHGYTVLCSGAQTSGGCGATCGFWEKPDEAVSKWNNRSGAIAIC